MFAELPGFWTSHITLFDRTHESSQCLYGKIQSSLLSVGIGPSWGFIYSSVHSVMLIVSLPDARHEHAFLKQSDFILLGGCFTWNNWHRSYWVRQRRIGADFLCLSLYLLIVRHLLGMSSMVCSGGSCHFQGLVFKNWERRICEVNYITHFFFRLTYRTFAIQKCFSGVCGQTVRRQELNSHCAWEPRWWLSGPWNAHDILYEQMVVNCVFRPSGNVSAKC